MWAHNLVLGRSKSLHFPQMSPNNVEALAAFFSPCRLIFSTGLSTEPDFRLPPLQVTPPRPTKRVFDSVWCVVSRGVGLQVWGDASDGALRRRGGGLLSLMSPTHLEGAQSVRWPSQWHFFVHLDCSQEAFGAVTAAWAQGGLC